MTENTSQRHLDFPFRANNLEESRPFCSQTFFFFFFSNIVHPAENSHRRPGEQRNDAESASLEGSSGRGQVSAEEIRWRCPPSRSPRPRRHSAAAASLLLPLEPPAFSRTKSNPLSSQVLSPTVELPYGCWPLRQEECR